MCRHNGDMYGVKSMTFTLSDNPLKTLEKFCLFEIT